MAPTLKSAITSLKNLLHPNANAAVNRPTPPTPSAPPAEAGHDHGHDDVPVPLPVPTPLPIPVPVPVVPASITTAPDGVVVVPSREPRRDQRRGARPDLDLDLERPAPVPIPSPEPAPIGMGMGIEEGSRTAALGMGAGMIGAPTAAEEEDGEEEVVGDRATQEGRCEDEEESVWGF
ncbi:hypothetical protein JCM5296_005115 [Sporobolomyces johnsonii]